MASSLELAGVIGTWAAVLLALVALIGVVAPLFLLRESRSDRYQALNSVDSQDTGYVKGGLKLRGEGRYFQKVNAPKLRKPPGPEVVFDRALAENPAQKLPGSASATGWVNFAATMELYTSTIEKGDELVISENEAWLPVHRFWILAFGLLGRYGDRKDRGIGISQSNARRIAIERQPARQAAHPSTGRILTSHFGLTGKLVWVPMPLEPTAPSRMMEKVYFETHSAESRQDPFPERFPLISLFWLSLGCLPLRHRHSLTEPSDVYDLATYRDAVLPKKARASRTVERRFFRFKKHEHWAQEGTQGRWVTAMGTSNSTFWRIQRDEPPEDVETACDEAAKDSGEWYSLPGTENKRLIARSDIHRLLLAAMTMGISPHGFLFDQSGDILKTVLMPAVELLSKNLLPWCQREGKMEVLFPTETVAPESGQDAAPEREPAPAQTTATPQTAVTDQAVSTARKVQADKAVESLKTAKLDRGFGRRRVAALANLDAALEGRSWRIPIQARRIIAILVATSDMWRVTLRDTLGDLYNDATLGKMSLQLLPRKRKVALVLKVRPLPAALRPQAKREETEPETQQSNRVEGDTEGEATQDDGQAEPNTQETSTVDEDMLNIFELDWPFIDCEDVTAATDIPVHGSATADTPEVSSYNMCEFWPDICAASLQACVRFSYFKTASISSTDLISLISDMGDVVQVSARPQVATRLESPQEERPRRRIAARQRTRRAGTAAQGRGNTSAQSRRSNSAQSRRNTAVSSTGDSDSHSSGTSPAGNSVQSTESSSTSDSDSHSSGTSPAGDSEVPNTSGASAAGTHRTGTSAANDGNSSGQ